MATVIFFKKTENKKTRVKHWINQELGNLSLTNEFIADDFFLE